MPELLEIVGQDLAIGRLQAVMSSTRMPHAMLFVGPDGVGRRTTAMALARTLLCEQPLAVPNAGATRRFESLPDGTTLKQACGKCPSCKMTAAGSHPDCHLVYKELAAYHEDAQVRDSVMQELGIDVIRSFLIGPVGRRSTCGRGKVFVVLEAELMSTDAQNSLLKTLEEPPPGVTLILLCENPEQLLPTTRSRCSTVKFALLPRKFVFDKLREQGLQQGEAQFWADFTEGSIGRAAKLSSEGMYAIKRDLLAQIAPMNRAGDAELGETIARTVDKLAEAAVKGSRTEHTEMSKNLAVRQATGAMLELIASAFRDAMTVAGSASRPIANADQLQAVEALAGKFGLVQLAGIIEQLSEMEQLLWRNVNHKTIWDNVVITCASAAPLRVV